MVKAFTNDPGTTGYPFEKKKKIYTSLGEVGGKGCRVTRGTEKFLVVMDMSIS